MKKLTFEESRQTLDVLGENGLKEIAAGDGIILRGSGTSSDPTLFQVPFIWTRIPWVVITIRHTTGFPNITIWVLLLLEANITNLILKLN